VMRDCVVLSITFFPAYEKFTDLAFVFRSHSRVARWYIIIPKISFWVHFEEPSNGKCWHVLRSFGKFCGHLVQFMIVWYNLWSFGIFSGQLLYFVVIWYISPVLVCCA
jgi:hypothetical protein